MTKINHSVLYFFTTIFISILTFANPNAEEKALLAKAKTESDEILQSAKTPTSLVNAQFRFCKIGQKLLDVQEGAARKKTDRQTSDERNSVLVQINSLLVVENILAEIDQQKKFHEVAQQAEASKQGPKYKKITFKEILSFNCKEMVGPENNPRDQKPTGREFDIEQISKDFRKSYDKNAIAKLPPQPKRGKAAVAGSKTTQGSVVQAQVPSHLNRYCATPEMQTYADKIFTDFTTKQKQYPSMGYPGGVGSCDLYFDLVRVGPKVYATDRKSDRKKATPNGDLIENGSDLYNFLARSRDAVPAPAVVPKAKPDDKKGPAKKAGAGT